MSYHMQEPDAQASWSLPYPFNLFKCYSAGGVLLHSINADTVESLE